jgi:hypothetical protein
VKKIQLCLGETVLQLWQKTDTVLEQCVSLSSTTGKVDSSQILAIWVGWCKGVFRIFTDQAVHNWTKNTFFIFMQQKISETGANRSVENCEMWWNVVHRVLQSVVFQTINCTAVDFSDGYNHGREKSLSVYCKGSTYSAPTQCIHFNPSLLGEFTVPKTASGYSCYNNMEHVHTIALMSPLAGNKAGVLTFSGYCTASGTCFVFLLTHSDHALNSFFRN